MKKLRNIIMPMICLIVAIVVFASCSSSNAKISSNIDSNNKTQRSAFVEYDNSLNENQDQNKDEDKESSEFEVDFENDEDEENNSGEDLVNEEDENKEENNENLGENENQEEDLDNKEENGDGENQEGEEDEELPIKDKLLDDLREIRERYKRGPIDARFPEPIPVPRPIREEK